MNTNPVYITHVKGGRVTTKKKKGMYREITHYLNINEYKTNQLLDRTRPQNCKKKNSFK